MSAKNKRSKTKKKVAKKPVRKAAPKKKPVVLKIDNTPFKAEKKAHVVETVPAAESQETGIADLIVPGAGYCG